MTIVDAMKDRSLFGRSFEGESWNGWFVALAATCGLLPIGEDAAKLYKQCTGRTVAPAAQAREVWFIVGRRGGKSRIAALVAVYLACFRSYADVLAPGEVGTLAVIAADRRQARVVMRYILAFLEGVPLLRAMVVSRTKETIELSNRITIEVHTASFRAVRGYTLIGVVADEIAFWPTDEAGANPDTEILNGLRPGMATVPGAMLIGISSPYARRGVLWEAHRRHYGQDNDPVLIWQAPTAVMNPTVDPQVIADAYEQDEAAARAEYGAQFRRDIESYISRESVDAVVVPGRRELGPLSNVSYRAFVDPSGGSSDSMTVAVAHRDAAGRVILDVVRECKPPFNPSEVVAQFAEVLKAYRITSVSGDRYGGDWPASRFREHGIYYQASERTRSEIYATVLPAINSGQVELLDHPRLIGQLCSLERRTARSGKDSIDHGPSGHDDVANSAAGALVLCKSAGHAGGVARLTGV